MWLNVRVTALANVLLSHLLTTASAKLIHTRMAACIHWQLALTQRLSHSCDSSRVPACCLGVRPVDGVCSV